MSSLQKLSIRQLRNITSIDMQPGSGINIIHGANGSGKTSILEAIHLLGLARSFRSAHLKTLIQQGTDTTTVFGHLSNRVNIGISRSLKGSGEIRIDGKTVKGAAPLAQQLPIQLFNPDTFRILEGSPASRRQFIDWGVFHVEHPFLGHWRLARKALQQRNALLKRGAAKEELMPWTHSFTEQSEAVDSLRAEYLERLLPHVNRVLASLLPDAGVIRFRYERGWDPGEDLGIVLTAAVDRERRYGYTLHGFHRAELRILMDRTGQDAAEILSRGQQKLVVCALKIAQGMLLQSENDTGCIYLIDDLPSELDVQNRERLCKIIEQLQSQVFITCIEPESLGSPWSEDLEMRSFHVKHGRINM